MIKQDIDYRMLRNPGYADSQERLNVLRNMVVDGNDAKAVQKYAEIFLDACEKDVLRYAKEGKTELMKEAAQDYRVASRFCNMLVHAIELGEKKEEILRNARRS